MYRSLFDLAGLAIVGWLPLLLLPRWRVSRWLAESMLFPAYLAVLYLVGIVPIVADIGPGIMRDFGSATGVLALLARKDLALVAWIHILAFDQVAGILLYRDNMHRRLVPLPVQSVLLFATLMFGPVGLLVYGTLRVLRRGTRTGERELDRTVPLPGKGPAVPVAPAQLAHAARAWLGREPLLTGLGVVGVGLGVLCLAAIAVVGVEVPPEGNLHDTATFDIAVGLFVLTLAAVLPLAGFSDHGARRWRAWMVGLVGYFYAIETVQAFRGLDPRFTEHGGVLDQAAGVLFGFVALGLIATTVVLGLRFFGRVRDEVPSDALRLALRYGFAAVGVAFAVGVWMTGIQGRHVGTAGNALPLHALGFHGIQAVPAVALLLVWADASDVTAHRLVHAAGITWLAACAALLLQTAFGLGTLELSAATLAAGASLAAWGAVLIMSAATWLRGGHAAVQSA